MLTIFVVPTIIVHAWSIGAVFIFPLNLFFLFSFNFSNFKQPEKIGQITQKFNFFQKTFNWHVTFSSHSCKLTLERSHLNIIMYMKYDNVNMYDTFMWNWFKITLCDDVIFIASSTNEAIRDDIQWSIAQEIIGITINQDTLVLWLHWFHYGMFIKSLGKMSPKRYGLVAQASLLNEQHLGHRSLFIYLDVGYQGLYHNVIILHALKLHRNWCQFFVHDKKYFEYLLGDPRCMGEEIFIMWKLGKHKLSFNTNNDVLQTYNTMRMGFKVKVKWGLKCN